MFPSRVQSSSGPARRCTEALSVSPPSLSSARSAEALRVRPAWIRNAAVAVGLGLFGASTSNAQPTPAPISFMMFDPSPQAGGQFGREVHVANIDLDADLEVLVGAPGKQASAGMIWVADGPIQLSGNQIWFSLLAATPTMGDEFGSQIETGDFNGDDVIDIAVSSPGAAKPEGPSRGEVTIFYGPITLAAGLVSYASSFTFDELVRNPNTAGGDRFGERMAAGDLDDDDFDDLVVGAPRSNTIDGAGIKYFYNGQAWFYPGKSLSTPREIFHPTENYAIDAFWGFDIAIGNVVDLPGYANIPDVVIGSNNRDFVGAFNAGDVVLFRNYTEPPVGFDPVKSYVLQRPAGNQPAQWVGDSIALGHYDGDLLLDVAVGGPGQPGSIGPLVMGETYVWPSGSFPNNPGNFTVAAPIMGQGDVDRFGAAIIWLDHDGNGLDSLFVGSPLHDKLPFSPLGQIGEGRVFVDPHLGTTLIEDPTPEELTAFFGFGSALASGQLALSGSGEDVVIGNARATYLMLAEAGEVRVVIWP